MSTSNLTFKELSTPYFKDVFDIIDRVMTQYSVPYYLIGATAIALQFLKEGRKPPRGTRDIDFALMLASIEEYDEVVAALQMEGFAKVEAPWTMYHQAFDVVIDLLPFGQIEENYTESFNQRYSDLHVLGFREVLENPNQITIEDKVANVPPLAGMVILKLVAWSDRPEDRAHDLSDILKIIDTYYDQYWDEVVDHHHDLLHLLDDSPLSALKIASQILGRQARAYLAKSVRLSDRILGLLAHHVPNPEGSAIARHWATMKNIDVESAGDILRAFESGLKE